jgi:putative flippase GtrA
MVGLVATAIDLGVFLVLVESVPIAVADAAALVAAAVVSYSLNRRLTFRGRPRARWVRHPGTFALVAVIAGVIDLMVVVVGDSTDAPMAAAKLIAIGGAAAVRWSAYRWVLFTEVRREMAERHDRPDASGAVRLSVVVPAFNEGTQIAETIATLREELAALVGSDLEILVVDDGSVDDTAARARSAGANVVEQPRNMGKGAAVRAGVLAASGRSIVFTDADLAYPAAMIVPILESLEDGWDVVVGSRRHEETTTLVRARRIRELGGRAVNWLTHLVLLGHFRDTQCGIKGFRNDIGKAIFERTIINGFAFDVEVFLIAEQDRYSLTEVPVRVENRQGSSVRLVRDSLRLLRDLLRIRRAAGKGAYRPNASQRVLAS